MTKLKVCLADRSEIFCEGLLKLMEREPSIEVMCVCHKGLEVIECACKNQPDVILVDTELPECSGIEAIQRIRERLLKTSIIVLTNSEEDNDLSSAIRAGAKAYISKNISIENLIKIITLVADGEIVVSPPMAVKLFEEFKLLEGRKDVMKLVTLLSKREHVVLSLVTEGLTNREIATTLLISENTAKVHLRNIMEKLHAHTRQQAVVLATVGITIQYISPGEGI